VEFLYHPDTVLTASDLETLALDLLSYWVVPNPTPSSTITISRRPMRTSRTTGSRRSMSSTTVDLISTRFPDHYWRTTHCRRGRLRSPDDRNPDRSRLRHGQERFGQVQHGQRRTQGTTRGRLFRADRRHWRRVLRAQRAVRTPARGRGQQCDLRVGPEHAEKFATLALEENVPIIFDGSGFLDAEEANDLIRETARQLFAKERRLKSLSCWSSRKSTSTSLKGVGLTRRVRRWSRSRNEGSDSSAFPNTGGHKKELHYAGELACLTPTHVR